MEHPTQAAFSAGEQVFLCDEVRRSSYRHPPESFTVIRLLPADSAGCRQYRVSPQYGGAHRIAREHELTR